MLELVGSRLRPDDLVIVTNHGGGRMTVEARIGGRVALVEVPRRRSLIAWPAGQGWVDQGDTDDGPGVPALAEEPAPHAGPAAG